MRTIPCSGLYFYVRHFLTNPLAVDQTLLGVIRRVYPSIIAHSIVGVQPMTLPSLDVFKTRYGYVKITKQHMLNDVYRNFLRLNNRKKYLRVRDLDAAGYPSVMFGDRAPPGCKDWCNEQFGPNAWLEYWGVFYFRDELDAMLFRFTWLDS